MKDEWPTFLASYNYGGKRWSFDFQAENAEDAAARLKRMAFATLDGELVMRIPAVPGAGLFVRLLAWLRNKAVA